MVTKKYMCVLLIYQKHMIKFPFIVCLTSYWIEVLLHIWLNFLPSGIHVKKRKLSGTTTSTVLHILALEMVYDKGAFCLHLCSISI